MKILVGIMYCIENELEACLAAVQRQTHSEYDYFIVDNLPNKEAHDKLYQTFMAAADEYQLFIKIDADMVLCRDTYFAEVVREFAADPDLTLLQVAVHDFFTDQLIFGLHNYRNTMRWKQRQELFTDKQGVTRKTVNDSQKLAPAAWHCPDPSLFQAFHFGVHKAVKVMQIGSGDKNLMARNIHWDNILRTRAHYRRSGDLRVGYAVLGAEIAFKQRFTFVQVDYHHPQLNQAFEQVKELSPEQLCRSIRQNTLFGVLPPALRLALLSLRAEGNWWRIPRATYAQVLKSAAKDTIEKKSDEVR